MCKDEIMRKLSAIEEKVLGVVEIETAGDLSGVDTEELGKAVDILKDLAKAKYYCAVTLSMLEELEEDDEPMGYNRRRYANGRYAPKGRGSYGYQPSEWDEPMGYESGGAMGASGGQGGSSGGGRSSGGSSGGQGGGRSVGSMGYGGAYGRYVDARMGYQHQATAENRRMMEESADDLMAEFEESVREIWGEADQRQKAKMKTALVNMANGLK